MNQVIVVGGGIAGLTATAYLSRSGCDPLLIEKEPECGGLINSFERDKFIYDAGIRATENSGILFPMVKQLGLDIEFIRNPISVGVGDQVIWISSEESIEDYQSLLSSLYPENIEDIHEIIEQIKKIMKYMEVQYGIENPAFMSIKENLRYFITDILPWMVRYAITVPKISRLNMPVNTFLKRYTHNQALIDIITQHFFKETPTYFALSYLKIYLDYHYPAGGTGVIPRKLTKYILDHGGIIKTNTFISFIDPVNQYLNDSEGNRYNYRHLIWAADLNSLYSFVKPELFTDPRVRRAVTLKRQELEGKLGNDSVFTLYLAVDKHPSYFSEKNTGHYFYTPSKLGETTAGLTPLGSTKQEIIDWLGRFVSLTTYEISIPVLRDSSLAPEEKTGLIISVLFDYHLTSQIQSQGWYDEFKDLFERKIIDVLDGSVYPGIKDSVIHRFSFTPLSLETRTANTHGAITGWAYTNNPMPAENRLPRIFNSTATPIPGVVQAGQWTYSPSGLPISILTGKLAADRVISESKSRNDTNKG